MSLTFVWKTQWELYFYSIFFLDVVLSFDIVIRSSLRFPIHRIFSDWLSLVAHSKEEAIFKLLMLKWDRHMVTTCNFKQTSETQVRGQNQATGTFFRNSIFLIVFCPHEPDMGTRRHIRFIPWFSAHLGCKTTLLRGEVCAPLVSTIACNDTK